MAASSSSTALSQPQVFINFRGKDLRSGFISHLVVAFKREKINVFTDEREVRGKPLDTLFERIERSTIALAVFSENYPESSWCLQELEKMNERMVEGNLVVIPIFYKVEPSTVRYLKGDFGDKLYILAKGDEKIKKWEEALRSIPNLFGITVDDRRDESEAINEIVKAVTSVLFKASQMGSQSVSIEPSENSNAITSSGENKHGSFGLEQRLKQLEDKLDSLKYEGTRSIGVVGMPGIGKTTPKYQVFINFRGNQLRTNFIGHLVDAMKRDGINVFIDTFEKKGKDIKILFKRIEKSRVALAIFSTKYTESSWCLDELVTIKKRADLGMLEVLPVFYKVSTESVKQLVGEFGNHFRRREWEYRSEKAKIDEWKKALECVSGKIGLVLDRKSLENDFIRSVITEVFKMLARVSSKEERAKSQVNQLSGKGDVHVSGPKTKLIKAH